MNATGKRARKRYGNRYAAKSHGRDGGPKGHKSRRRFGELKFSNRAGNVPMQAVQMAEEYTGRVLAARRKRGQEDDANGYIGVGSDATS